MIRFGEKDSNLHEPISPGGHRDYEEGLSDTECRRVYQFRHPRVRCDSVPPKLALSELHFDAVASFAACARNHSRPSRRTCPAVCILLRVMLTVFSWMSD